MKGVDLNVAMVAEVIGIGRKRQCCRYYMVNYEHGDEHSLLTFLPKPSLRHTPSLDSLPLHFSACTIMHAQPCR